MNLVTKKSCIYVFGVSRMFIFIINGTKGCIVSIIIIFIIKNFNLLLDFNNALKFVLLKISNYIISPHAYKRVYIKY